MNFMKQVDIGLLLLRLVFGGGMILGHGWPKLMKLINENPVEFGDPIGVGPVVSLILAVFAELLCSALVMLGFLTRWAVIPLIIIMLVAIFIVHIGDPFTRMEKAILYLVPFVVLLLTGPGKLSVDYAMKSNTPSAS